MQAKPYRRRILDDESSTDCNGNGSGEMELAEEDDASQSDKSEGSGASSIDEALSRLKMINEISEDDDDVLCFDGCGCWTVDEKTGDLYLPPDTESTKWPRIRLPLPLYQKLFQHQRIGVQWMASLHRNKIKGGILAVSEELV